MEGVLMRSLAARGNDGTSEELGVMAPGNIFPFPKHTGLLRGRDSPAGTNTELFSHPMPMLSGLRCSSLQRRGRVGSLFPARSGTFPRLCSILLSQLWILRSPAAAGLY